MKRQRYICYDFGFFFLFFVRPRAARLRTAAVIIRAARQIKAGAAVFEEVEDFAVFEASETWSRRWSSLPERLHTSAKAGITHDASTPQHVRFRVNAAREN